jgi:hypothetical protein
MVHGVPKRRPRRNWKQRRMALRRWYLWRRYGRDSMLPKFGRGEYVSVYRRGPFLDMHDERSGDVVRLVPYQPNHGVMIELWRDGRMLWRSHCDMRQFEAMGFGGEARAH